MIIKLNPFSKLADKANVQSQFFQFGHCSVHFSETYTLVKFPQHTNGQKAFEHLKGSKICGVNLEMQVISDEFDNNEESQATLHQKNLEGKASDIEIIIPAKQLSFEFLSNYEATPSGSYHSPCFPEINQSPIDSPLESLKITENPGAESPPSVIRLPVSQNGWKGIKLPASISPIPDQPQLIQVSSIPIPTSSKLSKIHEKVKKPGEFFMCAVCGKSIKKKSIKSHNTSKVHQMNLKMSN